MRWIVGFLILLILFSQGACYPARTAPTQITSPLGTFQVVPPSPATNFLNPIPITEVVLTPAFSGSPIHATQTSEEIDGMEIAMPVSQSITITIVYDNNPYDQRLNSAWGFSALVEYHDRVLLFDTGGDGKILTENMRVLGIDPTRIDSVVLSHAHGDHTGGLTAILDMGAEPVVYLPPSFPVSFKRQVQGYTVVNEVSPGQAITEKLWTTGQMGRSIPEQALVIQTDQGLVIITGCAHPGIVEVVEQAQEMFGEPVRLVLGGFHLGGKTKAEIEAILKDFRRLGVKQVAPCHCTGDSAITMFAAEYGNDFIQVGVGSVIRLDGAGQ